MSKKEIIKLKNIVLDLDETLVLVKFYEEIEEIKFRPHLKEFLHFLFKNFESVNIWSAASRGYVKSVVKSIDIMLPEGKQFRTIFTQDNCEYEFEYTKKGFYGRNSEFKTVLVKNLSRMFEKHNDMNKYNTMIVDDTEETFRNNYGNAIHIKPFFCDKKEEEEEKEEKEKEKEDSLLKVAEKLYEIKFKKLNFLKRKNREIDWDKKSTFKW